MTDRPSAEEEPFGDVRIAESSGQRFEHVAFAREECVGARPSWTRGDAEGSEQGGCLPRAVAGSDLLEAVMGRECPADRGVDVAGSQQRGEVKFGAGGFEGQLEAGEDLQREPEVAPG